MREDVTHGVLFIIHHLCELTGGAVGLTIGIVHNEMVPQTPQHALAVMGYAAIGATVGWFVKTVLDRVAEPFINKIFPKKK